jgi:type IV secretory pathway TrbF-like protein
MKMRGKLARLYASDGELDTPFRRAAEEWDRRMGSAVVQSRNWRLAAFFAVLGWLGASAGLVVLAQRPPVLRLVTLDRDGVPVSRVSAVAADDFKPTELQIAQYLRAWIIDVRRVSSDPGVTKQGWVRAAGRAVGTANQQLRAYLKPFGSPVERSRQAMVTVDPDVHVIKVTGETYQADWKEKLWTPHASQPVESAYRGLHRIYLRPPTTDDPDNAIGFFVSEYHWNQLR